ncbi:MAG: YtxH domain-containing protein [Coriobacteriales bacterium]|nr:YtxH domain-containing protein [Coriobacteriales bacterium]
MKTNTLLGIAFGAAAGFCAGLLLAPRTGNETRALMVDRVDELWGQGQDFYEKNVKDLGSRAADFAPAAAAKGDELREKIEIARDRIAEQVAKNAASVKDAMSGATPVATETVVTEETMASEESVPAVEPGAEAVEAAETDSIEE